jgi:DNA processing protein
MSADLRDLLALHLVDGLGPQRISALLSHFGSAKATRAASLAQLCQVEGIGEKTARSLLNLSEETISSEIAAIKAANAKLMIRGVPGYPAMLETLPAMPLILFARGNVLPEDARSVALVGTRRPNGYGQRITRTLALGLAKAGVCIVSGLAQGVDGIAHQAALAAGGRTIGVLGGGISRLYPNEHRELAESIVKAGAIISEAPMNAPNHKWRFPARNRIISALSRVIVIVQAPAESGALITATHAAEQGRTVLAVSGCIDDESQAGCHNLLRQGAILCRGVDDILEQLDSQIGSPTSARPIPTPATPPRQEEKSIPFEEPPAAATPSFTPVPEPTRQVAPTTALPKLEGDAAAIYRELQSGAKSFDELARLVGKTASQLANLLMGLEIKKVIRRIPGNRYEIP